MRFIIRKYAILIFLSVAGEAVFCQGRHPVYWVEFTDKEHTPYTIDKPEAFLSQRAIVRRTDLRIAIDTTDLPVDPVYVDSMENFGLKVINVSKWLNGVLVEVPDPELPDILAAVSFVKGTPALVRPRHKQSLEKRASSKLDLARGQEETAYLREFVQLSMLDGNALHDAGYKGNGMWIAILDAGFTNADSLSSLQHIWQSDRVIAYRDFVKDQVDFFDTHNHGSQVFSIIGGLEEGIFSGSAPEASFILVRTEDGTSEFVVEEYNWVCGAEYADSLGADIINSSLGYSEFDDSTQNHTYSELNGMTTPISKAATIAASRGIIVVTSAGNQGNDLWYHITAPADADGILSVGAVDENGWVTAFSSRGPSSDGRVKPDLCAQGFNTVSQHSSGDFVYCAGTSCSSPVLAGMVACLWQSRPEAGPEELIGLLKRGASHFFMPDDSFGYGIPNFIKAYAMLGEADSLTTSTLRMSMFPNPAGNELFIELTNLPGEARVNLSITDMSGRLHYAVEVVTAGSVFVHKLSDISFLPSGLYQVSILTEDEVVTGMLSKP